jgi:hypothetical protein
MKKAEINRQFDKLLGAMAPPIERTKPSSDQASDAERDACYSDTQTRPDTSTDDGR